MMRAPAATTARSAVSLRCARLSGAVVAMKIGATPTGSMITVNVTNVVPTMFQSTSWRPYAPGRSANELSRNSWTCDQVALVAVEREVHVVLRVAGPCTAPAPADGCEGVDDVARDHARPMMGAVAVRLRQWIAAHPAPHVRVLDRVEVDRQPVRVVRPVAGAAATGTRRRNRIAAFERSGGVAVLGLLAARPVDTVDRHVTDREMEQVEPVEHLRERRRGGPVDDQLGDVVVPVEASVGHGEHA